MGGSLIMQKDQDPTILHDSKNIILKIHKYFTKLNQSEMFRIPCPWASKILTKFW